ncbi:hypothetical protein GCM10007918_25970 [Piscinibacter gummiphilus]|nr:hypothetical protein GCM10007918_25970 [Piscinibacter gummiphilus]
MKRPTRKQVQDLHAADLDASPCWEYASDEEGRKGQDECTVRPLDLPSLPTTRHQVMVQAVFFFPNGRVRMGMITLIAGDDPSGHQPVLFVGKKGREHLSFYNGSFEPRKSEVRAFARGLEKVCRSPFPIRYVSTVQAADGRPLGYGELSGLYWLANWRTNELRCAT